MYNIAQKNSIFKKKALICPANLSKKTIKKPLKQKETQKKWSSAR